MDCDSKILIVAEKIAGILNQGIRLSPDDMHFIDSTFSSPSADEIQAILTDPDNCEREALMQLIFFPDEHIQAQLEPYIQNNPLSDKDIRIVLNRLRTRITDTTIYLPYDKGSFSISLSQLPEENGIWTDFALAHFIFHLNLTKILPDELVSVIDLCVSKEKILLTKVRLRNSRIDFTNKNIIWLSKLFRAFPRFSDGYGDILDFSLAFLNGMNEGTNIYERLMALKITYLKAIEKNNVFEVQMRKSNMETLLLQGKRPAGMDSITAQKRIALIDRISYAIYGKSLHIGMVVSEYDLGEIQTDDDAKNVMKLLG